MSKRAWGILLLIVLLVVAAVWWVTQNSTAAVVRLSSREQPACTNINTAQEGWTIEDKTVYRPCAGCTVQCRNSGTRQAAWYQTCEDGSQAIIAYADCVEQPPLPSNTAPYCRTDGSGEIGWFMGSRLIKNADCANCNVECRNAGTPQEGWYDACDGELLTQADCG
ncbi:MAG: hypothetical protein WCV62_02005 [Candidatus Peribacteraceae bacterium]|jgi:hypothetical protein